MASVTGVTVIDQRTLRVGFSAAITLSKFTPWKCRLRPTSAGGIDCIVNNVRGVGTSGTGNFTQFDLNCEPGLTPNVDYSLHIGIGGLEDVAGANTISTPVVAIPLANVPTSKEWDHPPLRTLTRAFGQGLAEIGGIPTTILVRDWNPGDPVLYVESTLAFDKGPLFDVSRKLIEYYHTGAAPAQKATWPPKTGVSAVMVGSRRFFYTWIDPSFCAFQSIRPEPSQGSAQSLAAGTVVYQDYFWSSRPFNLNYPMFW